MSRIRYRIEVKVPGQPEAVLWACPEDSLQDRPGEISAVKVEDFPNVSAAREYANAGLRTRDVEPEWTADPDEPYTWLSQWVDVVPAD